MKRFYFILFPVSFALIANNSFSQMNQDAKWFRENKIKTILVRDYVSDKYDGRNNKMNETFFNTEGHSVKFLMFSVYDSSIVQKDSNIYDDKGKRIESDTKRSGSMVFFSKGYKVKYKYKDNDTLIEATEFDERLEHVLAKTEYAYNNIGKVREIDSKQYNSNGGNGTKKILVYNNDGNMTQQTEYDSTGNILNKLQYKYDSKGKAIECLAYYKPVDLSGPGIYYYPPATNITYKYYTYNGKEYLHIETGYDSLGNKMYQQTYQYNNKYYVVEIDKINYSEQKEVSTEKETYYYTYYR